MIKRFMVLLLFSTGCIFAQNTPTVGALPDNGPSLPATCVVGQIYFRTSVTPGLNQCNPANTWTALATASGSGTVSANNGNAGAVANYAVAGGSTTVGPTNVTISTGGVISWPTGLGAINHITGPTDQGLSVISGDVGTKAINFNASAYSFILNNTTSYLVNSTGISPNADNVKVLGVAGGNSYKNVSSYAYQTATNCAAVGTAANPSVASCGAASAGSFSCATNASTGTCTVNTTAVTANSEILIEGRNDTTTGTRLGVTCNTGITTAIPEISAVVAATSFTINLGTFTANPECFSYLIIN